MDRAILDLTDIFGEPGMFKLSEGEELGNSPQRDEFRRTFRSLPDPRETSKEVVERVLEGMTRAYELPIEGGKYELRLIGKLEASEAPDPYDFKTIYNTLQTPKRQVKATYGPTVTGVFEVRNKETGQVLDKRRVQLGKIPTPIFDRSFIVDGKKRFIMHQWRRKAGVFSRENQAGELVTEFNLDPQTASRLRPFKIHFDRSGDNADFKIRYGSSEGIPAWDLARLMGATPGELRKVVDDKTATSILDKSSDARYERSVRGFYGMVYKKKPGTKTDLETLPFEVLEDRLRDQFNTSRLDPSITAVTLGRRTDRVNAATLLASFKRLQGIANGDAPDDRESIALKKIYSPTDLLAEAVGRESITEKYVKGIRNRLMGLSDNNTKVKVDQLLKAPFAKALKTRAASSMVQRADTSSTPIDSFGQATATTILGEGAIGSENAIPTDAKLLNPGSVGFLDPVHTPESSRAGVILNIPMRTKVIRDTHSVTERDLGHSKLVAELITPRGHNAEVSPDKLVDKVLGAFDQFDFVDGKIAPRLDEQGKVKGWRNGEIVQVDPAEVDFWTRDASNLYDTNSALIPFMNSTQGGRLGYSSKHTTQAVPLVDREVPLVQTRVSDGTFSNEEILAEEAGAVRAGRDGTIRKIVDAGPGDSYIEFVPDGRRSAIKIPLPKNVMLGGGTPLTAELRVTEGQKVKRGDLIADSNYTRDGVLAMGVNLTTAYLPYNTSTFEDSVTISESARSKLTSEHLYAEEASGETLRLGKKHWRKVSAIPLPSDLANKLDDDGIIKVGERINPGDMFMVGWQSEDLTDKETLARARKVGLYKAGDRRGLRYTNRFFERRWNESHSGEVVDVKKEVHDGNVIGAKVYIKTLEPAEVGDKIYGRHANKATIAEIVPDNEMLRNDKGEVVELLYNPAAVTGRINPSQNFETFLAKIARAAGRPELVENYAHKNNWEFVRKRLEDSGIADGEDLFDPRSGKTLPSIGVGVQYILKAKHMVDHKSKARGIGGFQESGMASRGQDGAQSMGELGTYGLIANDAREFLRDAQLNKSEDRPEVWTALAEGRPLPPGRVPASFVRFQSYLKAAGINMEQDSAKSQFKLRPLTDRDVLDLAKSGGAENLISSPHKTVKAGSLSPESGGLFDPTATGGRGGNKWSRFTLSRSIPNPIFEGAIRDVLGLQKKQFEGIMAGIDGVDTGAGELYGSKAIAHMLSSIDLGDVEKQAYAIAKDGKDVSKRSAAYRTLRTVQMLRKENLTPTEAFMRKEVLVLPANMRDIKTDKETGDYIVGDLNYLYRDLGLIDRELASAQRRRLPPKIIAKLEAGLYDGMRQLMQTDGSAPLSGADYQGIVGKLTGKTPSTAEGREVGNPKQSLLKKTLVQRRQILSGRTVIGPNDDLAIDEIALPKQIAVKIFEPMMEAEWRKANPRWANTGAGKEQLKRFRNAVNDYVVKGKEDREVDQMIERTIVGRYVAAKRDPVLWQYGFQAFKPVLTSAKTMQLSPLVYAGLNADNDGDSCSESVLVGVKSLDLLPTLTYGSPRDAHSGDLMHADEILTNLAVIHISEFPRVEGTERSISARVTEYDVPPGVQVPAYLPGGQMAMLDVTKFSVHRGCDEHVVVMRSGRSLVVSQDHSLAVLDPDTLEVVKLPPTKSVGGCVPRLLSLTGGTEGALCLGDGSTLPEDSDLGWWLGVMVGDGWESSGILCLAHGTSYSEKSVAKRWSTFATEVLDRTVTTIEMPHLFEGKECVSIRRSFRHKPLADAVPDLIGHGSANKHLPPGFVGASVSFRRGLLMGLLDTDGSCCWSSSREVLDPRRNTSYVKKSQFIASYVTKSPRLSREIGVLCSTLGVDTVVSTHTREGRTPEYMVYLSTQDVQACSDWLLPTHTVKLQNLARLYASEPSKPSQKAIAPLPPRVADILCSCARGLGATKKTRTTDVHAMWFSWYAVLRRSSKKGQVMPLQTAQDIASHLRDGGDEGWANHCDDEEVTYLLKWAKLVLSTHVRWDEVVEAKATGRKMTMWDLTVPGSLTFTCSNGLVVWDTMAVFAPISKAANDELRDKMRPQQNLFSMASGSLAYGISHEAILGLNRVSRDPTQRSPIGEFATVAKAREAFIKGTIGPNDLITIAGKKTTLGRQQIDDLLPGTMTLEGLAKQGIISPKFGEIGLSKGDIKGMSTHIAIQTPQAFGNILNKLRQLGQSQATLTGTTLLMEDFRPILVDERKKAEKTLLADISKLDRTLPGDAQQKYLRRAFDAVLGDLNAQGKKILLGKIRPSDERSNVNSEMTFSGARVNFNQLQQVMFGPGAVIDGKGDVVGTPILRGYSEGLDATGHWGTMHGARMGTVSKVIEVQDPGYLSKQVINTTMDQVVTEADCGTTKGVWVNIAKEKDDLEGRLLARPVALGGKLWGKNTAVDGTVLGQMRQKGAGRILVRSPLTCEADEGVCQKCVGNLPNGKTLRIGANFGVMAGQSIGERSTQLSLSQFHTGGVYVPGSTASSRNLFLEASNLLRMPGTMGGHKAVVAPEEGSVSGLERNVEKGGWDVSITTKGDGPDSKVFIPGNRHAPDGSSPQDFFKEGRKIGRGEIVTDGIASPKEILQATQDMDQVRGYLVDRLGGLFSQEGVLRRNIEGVVRALTSTVEVHEPGDSDLLPGQRMSEQEAQKLSKKFKGMSLRPVFRGVDHAPREYREDFLSRLNYNNLRKVLTDSAQMGSTSTYHSTNPIPALAYGAEFNRSGPGSPLAPARGKY